MDNVWLPQDGHYKKGRLYNLVKNMLSKDPSLLFSTSGEYQTTSQQSHSDDVIKHVACIENAKRRGKMTQVCVQSYQEHQGEIAKQCPDLVGSFSQWGASQ